MKHLSKAILFSLAFMLGNLNVGQAQTTSTSMTVQVIQISITAPDHEEPEPNDVGHRKPGKPFSCTFDTESGIEFIGQETPEFALFEIYVTDSECIYASGDEFDFIDHLFTLSGSYQICLTTTDGIVYAGYLNL